MTSSHTNTDYLLSLLTSNQVKNIDSSTFVATNPTQTELPLTIDPKAVELLKNISGRIYPVALRGKCQAGKSTTLNRIAKISNFPMERLLEVAEGFGGSTTEGIWLMAIIFTNEDALLLFDVQGTDRGADELTHKLIALTDHICTKVVDVFRMPVEGFSNEYINSLYCLAMGRDSVRNLRPASDKAILWTNCALPKRSPLRARSKCNTPTEYQVELLSSSVGERAMQGAKAKTYAEGTPIITTSKPPDEILFEISELENDHIFIQTEIMPALKQILKNIQPVKINSHVIKGGNCFVEYLNNVYISIKASTLDLPFCALPMIRSIAMTALKDKKLSITNEMNQEVMNNSNDMYKISNILVPKLRNIGDRCITEFKQELSDLPTEQWKDQLAELEEFTKNEIRKIVDRFKSNVLQHFLQQEYPNLNQLFARGYQINQLQTYLQTGIAEIMRKMDHLPFLQGNITTIDKECVGRALNNHKLQLCHAQENAESDWRHRLNNYEKQIYSTDSDGIDRVIEEIIREHKDYSQQQFLRFNVEWKHFFNVETMKTELKRGNTQRSEKAVSKCRNKCVAEFNRKIGIIMSAVISVPEKYGKLKSEIETCLHTYYNALPWPLNDQTFGAVDNELQQIFNQVMQKLYTPAVKEQLKRDRIAQMESMSNSSLGDNESLLWVYCVQCQRIFAGRTKGCVNVTCCHFTTKQGTQNVDHGCGLEFQWAKAQPVPIANLPQDFWFSNIEVDQRAPHVKNVISAAVDGVRRMYGAVSRATQTYFYAR